MKLLTITAAFLLLLSACSKSENETLPESQPTDSIPADTIPADTIPDVVLDNIYQFRVLDGNNDSVSLSTYMGQVMLVVNTATQCGYTPQYTDLENIYQSYRDSGFVILDFPCNQFGGQAPGSYDDIHNFCTTTYNITFPQFAKIDVNGSNASPLYVWLKEQKPGNIRWNFTKFLIDREGNVVKRFEPEASMATVRNAVKNLL